MQTAANDFGRIGVLMGGDSSEREVSLKSGRAVYNAFRGQALDVVAIDIKTANRRQNQEFIKQADIDIAFIALHGRFGEDGQIQSLLEEMDIPYVGSGPAASALAMDKIASREIFEAEGLAVPNYRVVSGIDCAGLPERIFTDLRLPLVIKPSAQGSSVGLSFVKAGSELLPAIEYAMRFNQQVIVEEYIPGRELTVGIIGNLALPVVEIIPQNKFYDYEAKYTPGKSDYVVPAVLPEQLSARIQEFSLVAHNCLGCFGFSRVDIRLSRDEIPFILEVNTIPGLTETSLLPKAAAAAGMNFARLCNRILRLGLERSSRTHRPKGEISSLEKSPFITGVKPKDFQ